MLKKGVVFVLRVALELRSGGKSCGITLGTRGLLTSCLYEESAISKC